MEKCKEINLKKQFILQGLDCAGCAAKIERKVNSLDNVKAVLNFGTSTLTVEISNQNLIDTIDEKVNQIVKSIEPDVIVGLKDKNNIECNHNVKHDHNHSHHNNDEGVNKKEILFIILGCIIFSIAYFAKINFKIKIPMYLISYIFIGGDIALRAIKNIFKGEIFDENFLMFIATIGAFSIGEYPESIFVMLFYKIGEAFQDKAVDNSRKSIKSLMSIKPEIARIKLNDDFKIVDPSEVKINDIIVVKPGEKIPLDGVVLDGKSMIDTSNLTGESIPKIANVNDEVLSGCINLNSVLTLKVNKTFSNSAVSKILDLVENAGAKKAPTEKFITKFARYYTPVVVFCAIALAVIPTLVMGGMYFNVWLKRALIFLVVSCPCALVISVPLGFFAGIGNASKNGILIKGGNYLEALNNIDTMVFDKTGTLTKGIFEVSKINNEDICSKEDLIKYASYAEFFSNHPIANSIRKYYGQDINKNLIKDYKEISGRGISAKINEQDILVGNYKLMQENNISFKKSSDLGTIVYIALNEKYLGYIVISDKIKEDSIGTISKLKKLGIKNTIMLTGDEKLIADKIGHELNIDKIYSELLPKDKVDIFEKQYENKKSKKKIVFVGDGVNDAPVLTRADVGIAMGALGSDAAIEAADVILMTDEPSKLVDCIKISKYTQKIVKQNIIFALSIKFLILILGVFGFANMWEAVFADVGVALIAILNSMRILKYKC